MPSNARPLSVDCPDCENQLTVRRPPTGERLPPEDELRVVGVEAACGECGNDLDLYYLV